MAFQDSTMVLTFAFEEVFKENSKKLYIRNWIEEVQNELIELENEKDIKGTPAFIDLCQKATKINKDLLDIKKFETKFEKCCSDPDLTDEQKISLIEEIKILVKVMGDIAVCLNIPRYTVGIQGLIYDIEKGGLQKNIHGHSFSVSKDDLSEEQGKLTPIAWTVAHPPPEKLGNNSC